VLILGHRGAPREAPENTLASYREAIRAGADGVELDVRLTVDRRLALRHDEGLPDGRRVSEVSLAELREAEPDVPTLDQALDELAASRCVVEMKSQGLRNPEFTAAVGAELERRSQSIVVSSFDPLVLAGMRERVPDIRRALLLVRVEKGLLPLLDAVAKAGHSEIHIERRILTGELADHLLAACAARGIGVVAWTVNDPQEARIAGLAGVITDLPGDMVRALRGQPAGA
jgi:glycerophosphoryl diester phosphodiesterase